LLYELGMTILPIGVSVSLT